MLTAEKIARYRQDGFVKGSHVLSNGEVDELRDEMSRVIRDQDRKDVRQPVLLRNLSGNDDAPVWQIVNIWEASDAFARLIRNRTIGEEAAQLAGASELRIWHDQIQYKPAGKGGVNMWHQDSPYWPPLEPKDQQITAWVALDDVDESNGCMSMVPGSHRWGNQIEFLHTIESFDAMPSEFDGHAIEVRTCPVRAGEVHYHHSLAWHGSRANTSDRPRRAIALHFITPKTKYAGAAGDHSMKPFIDVADGVMLQGKHFPITWKR
jgi:ectoine hydroxylase-related dioxygenase (phytanoyl-CoA dioxygenase family)